MTTALLLRQSRGGALLATPSAVAAWLRPSIAPAAVPPLLWRRHASGRATRSSSAPQPRPAASSEQQALQPSFGMPAAARTGAVRNVLGSASVASLAAAAARHAALAGGGAAPPPAASHSLPRQPNDRTTVLLVGWLGSQKKHLKKYEQLHEAAGRRVICIRPSSFAWLSPDVLEQPRLHDCMYQLAGEAAQGRSIVIHALSNMGAFFVSALLHELQRQSESGAEGPFGGAERERMRVLLRQAIRGVIFDSAPAPLSPQLITRGYVGFLLSRFGKGHHEVRYSVPWLNRMVEAGARALLRFPTYRRHALSLHLSMLQLLPLSSNLLYVYSHADHLIPAEDVLAHARRQALLGSKESHAAREGDLPDGARALVNVRTDQAQTVAAELERDEGQFLTSLAGLSEKERSAKISVRNSLLLRRSAILTRPLPVHSVRVHMEQPAGAAESSAAGDEPRVSDDPIALLSPLHAHVSRLRSSLRSAPVDVLHGSETAVRLDALTRADAALVRSVLTARFRGSAHVQHQRAYPTAYAQLIDEFVAHFALPAMPAALPPEVQRMRAEAKDTALPEDALPVQQQVDAAVPAQA